MTGMQVVIVACSECGNVDLTDLEKKAAERGKNLAAIMITYPSIHGMFEEGVKRIYEIVHNYGD